MAKRRPNAGRATTELDAVRPSGPTGPAKATSARPSACAASLADRARQVITPRRCNCPAAFPRRPWETCLRRAAPREDHRARASASSGRRAVSTVPGRQHRHPALPRPGGRSPSTPLRGAPPRRGSSRRSWPAPEPSIRRSARARRRCTGAPTGEVLVAAGLIPASAVDRAPGSSSESASRRSSKHRGGRPLCFHTARPSPPVAAADRPALAGADSPLPPARVDQQRRGSSARAAHGGPASAPPRSAPAASPRADEPRRRALEALGLREGATEAEIRRAFRRLAASLHPGPPRRPATAPSAPPGSPSSRPPTTCSSPDRLRPAHEALDQERRHGDRLACPGRSPASKPMLDGQVVIDARAAEQQDHLVPEALARRQVDERRRVLLVAVPLGDHLRDQDRVRAEGLGLLAELGVLDLRAEVVGVEALEASRPFSPANPCSSGSRRCRPCARRCRCRPRRPRSCGRASSPAPRCRPA